VTANPEHMEALTAATNAVDDAVKVLITDELSELRPGLEEAAEVAAERLREATSALMLSQQQLADIDDEIASAEASRADWAAQLDDLSAEKRVTARHWLTVWDAELDSLRGKRSQVSEALQPVIDERSKARDALAEAQDGLAWFGLNLLAPYTGMGQLTEAYRLWRVGIGHLTPVLLAGDDSHPEWDAALEVLATCCLTSGYRTDDLPQEAEAIRRYWDGVRDAASSEPAPTGQAVAATVKAELASAALDQVRPEYRVRTAPVAKSRDYMQAPHVAAQMRGR
jgi:hypothetical protein